MGEGVEDNQPPHGKYQAPTLGSSGEAGGRKCSPNIDQVKFCWKHPAREPFPRLKTRHAQGWAQSRRCGCLLNEQQSCVAAGGSAHITEGLASF